MRVCTAALESTRKLNSRSRLALSLRILQSLLDKWLPAVWPLLVSAKNGISSYELSRALGVTQKTAWFMLHRVRLAMQSKSFMKFGGHNEPIEVDETFVGAKASLNIARRSSPERCHTKAWALDGAAIRLLSWECLTVRLAKFAPRLFRISPVRFCRSKS